MHEWDSVTHRAVNEITGTPYPKLFYLPMSWLVGDSNDWKWMQFTGLHDKNGKEIYEGDIVKGSYFIGEKEWDSVRGEVKLGRFISSGDGQGFGCDEIMGFFIDGTLTNDDQEYGRSKSLAEWESIEIIGNIYENPDLLKE